MKIVVWFGVLLVGACLLAAGCGSVSPSGSDGGGGAAGTSSDGSGNAGRGGAGGSAGTGGAGACAPGQVWCPGCTPGTGACYSGGCPGIACPAACDQVTTVEECDARSDCHSVFTDPGTCGCASIGCCAHFSGCAPGDHGQCRQPSGLACRIATPFCESPAFVVSYTSNCYEGCVRADDCAP